MQSDFERLLSRPLVRTLSKSLRPTEATRALNRMCGATADDRQRRDEVIDQIVAGRQRSKSGAPSSRLEQFARRAVQLYRHGENIVTWPHCRIVAPASRAGFENDEGLLVAERWAAAARPTGPAPITATGNA